jgi:hypothetical protein
VVEEITAYLGVMANDVKSRHGLGGSVDAASGHEWSLWKSALLAELRNKLVACLEAAEITLGDVRQRQEQEAEARRRKEEETSRKEEEEMTRKREEEARAQAAAARREEEEKLRKLLGDFDLSNEDALSKIAAADIKTVADLALLEPEDVEGLGMSLVSRKKFTKLLEHVAKAAAAAAAEAAAEEARRAIV